MGNKWRKLTIGAYDCFSVRAKGTWYFKEVADPFEVPGTIMKGRLYRAVPDGPQILVAENGTYKDYENVM